MSFHFPVVFGHRGACAVKTENTLEAFEYACQSGIMWVELDAVLSKDGIPMVFHDETLDRLSEVKGRTEAFTASELQSFLLKGGSQIPTLAQVLDLLNKYKANVNIEIKPSSHALARTTASAVWQVVREKQFDNPDRLVFSSFDWDALEETAVLAPDIRRGVLVHRDSGDWRQAAQELKAYSIHFDAALLTPALICEIRDKGYHLAAYTVNDISQARKLRDLGVEAFFSDNPAEMQKGLE